MSRRDRRASRTREDKKTRQALANRFNQELSHRKHPDLAHLTSTTKLRELNRAAGV